MSDQPAGRAYTIPIAPGSRVAISGPFPITQPEWDQMMTVLNAMKPGLIKPEPITMAEDQ